MLSGGGLLMVVLGLFVGTMIGVAVMSLLQARCRSPEGEYWHPRGGDHSGLR